jgi:hypothetical protein
VTLASRNPRAKTEPRWLVLFHQIPPRPDYLRVRAGRQLRALGAVAIKNSVYVVPREPRLHEALARVGREIRSRGGEVVVCEARFVEGLDDQAVEARFRDARDRDYAALAAAARELIAAIPRRGAGGEPKRRELSRKLERLQRRLHVIGTLDPFGATGREAVVGLLSLAEDRLHGIEETAGETAHEPRPRPGTTWVTRRGVMVDRIASAWLIRRFIDRAARFKFVGGRGYRPARGEVRFDMAGAEHTHEGERCTFEVLLERFELLSTALRAIGEIVHDLDLEDERFGRPEASGVRRLIAGLALASAEDGERLERGAVVFDGLYASFQQPRKAREDTR